MLKLGLWPRFSIQCEHAHILQSCPEANILQQHLEDECTHLLTSCNLLSKGFPVPPSPWYAGVWDLHLWLLHTGTAFQERCFPALFCASIAATWRWEEWRAPSHFLTFIPLPFLSHKASSSISAGGKAGSLPASVVTISHECSLLRALLCEGRGPYALGKNTAPGHWGRLWQKEATPTQLTLSPSPFGRRQLALGFPVLVSLEFKLQICVNEYRLVCSAELCT